MKTTTTPETTRTTIDIKTATYLKYKRRALRFKTSAKKLIEETIEEKVNNKPSAEVK